MQKIVSIDALVSIVKEASTLMITDHFDISSKDGYANIVTSSDIAVQKFLCEKLSIALPGSGFYCEEEDYITGKTEGYIWVIDPIDGTSNYSRGIPNCAISVALVNDGGAEMGVVYSPYANELFTAVKGEGAFFNGKQIHVSDRVFANGLFCSAFCLYRREYADICMAYMKEVYSKCNDFRRFGVASLEICYLALGRCDLYFEYRLYPWDYAAASLILMEAGGYIAGENGSPIAYDNNSMVFAANTKENIDTLVKLFNQVKKKF